MCGIAGIYHSCPERQADRSRIVDMTQAIAHRGPDEMSCHVEGNIGLGVRRLSIIDVMNGHQPFFNADRSVALVCNGEIFNYAELRAELEAKGYVFRTRCDVEVLVHLYTAYGVGFLPRLNGQFAFAIYDKRSDSLFLARDPFGICPLFYTFIDGSVVFASEIKAIVRHPLVEKAVNPEALDQVLTFPGPVSPVTLFKNISSLQPGHYMMVSGERIHREQYWDLIYPEESELGEGPESAYIDELEHLLLKSVKYRLNSDVPIGFYLSGGLDSSLIGGLMKALTPEVSYPAFSIGFPSDEGMDERKYQQQMLRHLNTEGAEILFDSSAVQQRLQQAVWASECALKESYNTCSLLLSETVRKNGIKVILSGEGADELFGGYVGYRLDEQFRQSRQSRRQKDVEDLLEDECRDRLWGDAEFFYEKNYYAFAGEKKSLYSGKLREQFSRFDAVKNLEFNKDRIRNRHILHKRSYVDLKLRLSDHLIADHCDRVAYANSVEGRYPFLDIELVDFVRKIPPGIKLKGSVEKYILKRVAGKYIPESIIHRQKFGFIAPGSPSLLQSNIEWIQDLMSYDRIRRQGYFDADVVEQLKKCYQRPGFSLNLPFESDMLIVVITFNIFLDLFNMPTA